MTEKLLLMVRAYDPVALADEENEGEGEDEDDEGWWHASFRRPKQPTYYVPSHLPLCSFLLPFAMPGVQMAMRRMVRTAREVRPFTSCVV